LVPHQVWPDCPIYTDELDKVLRGDIVNHR
jgi:hypothetical protein